MALTSDMMADTTSILDDLYHGLTRSSLPPPLRT